MKLSNKFCLLCKMMSLFGGEGLSREAMRDQIKTEQRNMLDAQMAEKVAAGLPLVRAAGRKSLGAGEAALLAAPSLLRANDGRLYLNERARNVALAQHHAAAEAHSPQRGRPGGTVSWGDDEQLGSERTELYRRVQHRDHNPQPGARRCDG